MKKILLSGLGALACVLGANAASAQAVTPATTQFQLTGPVQFSKVGFPLQVCQLTFLPGAGGTITGADIGGNRANTGALSVGTNTVISGTLCPALTVSATGFKVTTIITSGTLYGGTIDHVVVNSPLGTMCDQLNVPFTINYLGQATFNTTIAGGTVPGTCTVVGTLQANNGVVGTN